MAVITDEAQFYTTQHNTQVIEYVSECVCVFPFCCEVGDGVSHSCRSVEEMATRWWVVGKRLEEKEENGSILVTCAMAKPRLKKEEKDLEQNCGSVDWPFVSLHNNSNY